jgi:hypothetical protein
MGHSVAQTVLFIPTIILNEKETGNECRISEDTMKERERSHAGAVVFPGQIIAGESYGSVYIPPSPGKTQPIVGLRLIGCIFYSSPVDDLPHYTRVAYWVADKKTQGGFTANSGTFEVELIQGDNRTQAY